MKMKEKQNLTSGNITKNLVLFALPLLWANLLQSFYSIADMFVVGRTVGQSGLAAVSNASMICFIINSFCLGITMGGTVLIAQLKGAGDRKGQTETVGTASLHLIKGSCRCNAGCMRIHEDYLLWNYFYIWISRSLLRHEGPRGF